MIGPAVHRRFRIFLDGLAVLSLGLAIGVAVLWVRSYRFSDEVVKSNMPTATTAFLSQQGRLALDRRAYTGFEFLGVNREWRRKVSETPAIGPTADWEFLGFSGVTVPPVTVTQGLTVSIRCWTVPTGPGSPS